jgi:predicted amino acid-binding ACT domain protein
MQKRRFYTLSGSCPDQVGIISRISGFIAQHQGWILESSYHADDGNDDHASRYFMRMQVKADSLPFHLAEFRERFAPLAAELSMNWKISDSAVKRRVVLMVSKQEHCLYDLLARWQSKELDIEIPCVISNHDTFKAFVEWHGIPFHHVPISADNKQAAHAEICRIYDEVKGDTMVLARYMQILPADMCARYPGTDDQHPPLVSAQFRRCPPLPPGLPARRQADRSDLPLRHPRTRPGTDHRAGRDPYRPFGFGRRHGALWQGHREGGTGARPALSPRRPGAATCQQNRDLPLSAARKHPNHPQVPARSNPPGDHLEFPAA